MYTSDQLRNLLIPILFLCALHVGGQSQNKVVLYDSPFRTQAGNIIGPLTNGELLLSLNESSNETFPVTDGFSIVKTGGKVLRVDSSGAVLNELHFSTGYQAMPDTNYQISEIKTFGGDLWILVNLSRYKNDSIIWTKAIIYQYATDLAEKKQTLEIPDSLNFFGWNFDVDEASITVIGRSRKYAGIYQNEQEFQTVKTYNRQSQTWKDYREEKQSLHVYNTIYSNPLSGNKFWLDEISQNTQVFDYDTTTTLEQIELFEIFSQFITAHLLENGFVMAASVSAPFSPNESILKIDQIDYNYNVLNTHEFRFGDTLNGVEPMSFGEFKNGDLSLSVVERARFGSNRRSLSKIYLMGPVGSHDIVHTVPLHVEGEFFVTQHQHISDSVYAVFGTTRLDSLDRKRVAALIITDLNGITSGIHSKKSNHENHPILLQNPVQEQLQFRLPHNQNPVSAQIRSVNGQEIRNQLVTTGTATVDISSLSPGIYLVTIKSNTGADYTQRFIKQ